MIKIILISTLFICVGCGKGLTADGATTPTPTPTPSLTVTSPSFTASGSLTVGFSDTRLTQCAGSNDFPGLSWTAGPSGTLSYVIIVDDPDGSSWVHLNLYNLSPATVSIAALTASAQVVTFPDGTVGNNSWVTVGGETRTTGWAGPCPPSGSHRYVFYVYALSTTLPSLNNTNHTSFESTYSSQILAKGYIIGNYP